MHASGSTQLTPLVSLSRNLRVKLELSQPGGSHKTRAARHMLHAGLREGRLRPGRTTVIEKTGGNFGMGLAVECARIGVDLELIVGLSFSPVKRRALGMMGARLVGRDMLREGMTPREVLDHHLENQGRLGRSYFWPDQFSNPEHVRAHYLDTGAELSLQLRQQGIFRGQPLSFVGGAGTGAHLEGVTRRLREDFDEVEMIVVEPEGNCMRQSRHVEHGMEGISVGVVPPLLCLEGVDEFRECTHAAMQRTQRAVASTHSLLLGNSSAGVIAVAEEVARGRPGRQVVTLGYDSASWYLGADTG